MTHPIETLPALEFHSEKNKQTNKNDIFTATDKYVTCYTITTDTISKMTFLRKYMNVTNQPITAYAISVRRILVAQVRLES